VTRWVALLRGVNVGGHRRVPMADLRQGLAGAGLSGVRTYLQSGNAVFRSDSSDAGEVAALVREVVAQACGVDADVVVRTHAELADVVARNPWPELASTPKQLHVLFLSQRSDDVHITRVGTGEQVAVDGREVWVWYGGGAGRSRLQVQVPDAVVTARNFSTVTALALLSA
jgi:uncharacterized protein (DUF1697 family)